MQAHTARTTCSGSEKVVVDEATRKSTQTEAAACSHERTQRGARPHLRRHGIDCIQELLLSGHVFDLRTHGGHVELEEAQGGVKQRATLNRPPSVRTTSSTVVSSSDTRQATKRTRIAACGREERGHATAAAVRTNLCLRHLAPWQGAGIRRGAHVVDESAGRRRACASARLQPQAHGVLQRHASHTLGARSPMDPARRHAPGGSHGCPSSLRGPFARGGPAKF